MLQVKQIVNSVFSSNTFILSDDELRTCFLVDVGDVDKVIGILPDGAIIKGVLLTHTHFDHIYGINELYRRFPEIIVYTSEYGKEALYSAKKNFSFYHEKPIVFEGNNIVVLHEGDEIEIGYEEKLKVLETPGHCPSCLTYYNDDMIFTGDSYIPGVSVVTKLPKGNRKDSNASIQKILTLAEGRVIFAGHDKENWTSWI